MQSPRLRQWHPHVSHTRECLATLVDRKIKAADLIDQLFNPFVFRGIPEHIRFDSGPEFTARADRRWLNRLGVEDLVY